MPLLLALSLMVLIGSLPAAAQAPPAGAAEDMNALAKQTQNPVADLTAVPFQFNFNSGGDLEDRTSLNLNVQPVIPFRASDDWKVIARFIVPVDSFAGPGDTRFSGFGDVQAQLYVTPARAGSLVWGIGPTFSLPTATAAPAETGTLAVGPAAVVVKTTGPWVLGGLISQLWPVSDAGDDPKTDLLTIQPFVNYNFGGGWALGFGPVITANWNAESDDRWTVPLGLGVSRTTVFNRRPMTLGVQYYANVEHPAGGPGRQIRFVLSLLYPR